MNKLISLAAASALLVGLSLGAAGSAVADPAGDAMAAGVVGGVLGFMAGTAAASGGDDAPVYHHHFRRDEWERHVEDCEDAYGWRYDPDSDLVTRHGRSFYCDL